MTKKNFCAAVVIITSLRLEGIAALSHFYCPPLCFTSPVKQPITGNCCKMYLLPSEYGPSTESLMV